MDKICEFCKALSPVVYCTADAAYLCLSCDAKVHSANALSYRHDRTLLCQSCGSHPAYIRCLERQRFVCQSCDPSGQVSFLDERKVVISSYVGSPSAKELAVFWGFNLNELESNYYESEMGSSTREMRVRKDDNYRTNTCLILQQILELERFQLSGSVENSSSLHSKDRNKMHKTLRNKTEHIDRNLNIREPIDSSYDETIGESLRGDLFWLCKTPAYNNESWFHNMEDIAVYDEVQSLDDMNIPDVDLTFRNFEELFGSEHEASSAHVSDENMAFSSVEKHPPFGKVHSGYSNTIEVCAPSFVSTPDVTLNLLIDRIFSYIEGIIASTPHSLYIPNYA